MSDKDLIVLLTELLEFEPNWVTHPMSCWNRARRLLIKLQTGEEISEARSYDSKLDKWVL